MPNRKKFYQALSTADITQVADDTFDVTLPEYDLSFRATYTGRGRAFRLSHFVIDGINLTCQTAAPPLENHVNIGTLTRRLHEARTLKVTRRAAVEAEVRAAQGALDRAQRELAQL